ncbi:MAG: hypothetical protein II336_03380 [Loktanella sp.]|nr:hypothetical protein [Loktanella sp.]
MLHLDTPSEELMKAVRAHFVQRGTSFSAFCADHGYVRQSVALAVSGKRNGAKATALFKEFMATVRVKS